MTITNKIDFEDVRAELGEAKAALSSFVEDCRRLPEEMGGGLDRIKRRILDALLDAATGGEVAFRQLAKTILEEMARVALGKIMPPPEPSDRCPPRPCGDGPVMYGNPVAVHFHLSGGADANAIARHQGQIAAAVARAVAYGRRNL